jgi:hypothetical protein
MERTHFELCLLPVAKSEPDHNMIHNMCVDVALRLGRVTSRRLDGGAIKLTLEASHPPIIIKGS